MGLSVYLITKNEGAHLAEVLASCAGADEVVVVDSGSTDRTLEIARAAGAKVIHQDWLGFARQKDFALKQCQHEWVLNMDGDEILSVGAMPRIREAIACGDAVGYRIARDDEFMGESMSRSHCVPFLRVYRRDQAVWDLERTVHEHIEVPGKHPTIPGV
ncbi:MAG: glycosyltransferase family 2 protein, partial [Nitrospiraceae bacterium]